MNAPLLEVRNLEVRYGARRAVRGVSFQLAAGECLGLVGESGSGKTSLARALAGLVAPAAGEAFWWGAPLAPLSARARARRLQYVFQHPYHAFNPRRRVDDSVAEPLGVRRPELGRRALRAAAADWLRRVGLDPALGARLPGQLSGGQCQRAAIARALINEPELLLCDEPVSALDVSVRAQILRLLAALRAERRLSLLFIAHDLAVVRHFCDRVLVMYAGRIVEDAPVAALFGRPRHPYTAALLAAEPRLADAPPRGLPGEPPPAEAAPRGCAFAPRCPLADARCAEKRPRARRLDGTLTACHHAERL